MRQLRIFVVGVALLAGASVTVTAEVINVDNPDLARLLEQDVPLVDVRTPGEWQETGVVAGSRLLTFFDAQGRYDIESWLSELAEIAGPDEPVILICRSGNRSLTIARYLDNQAGYQHVYNVENGIRGWIRDGKPTRTPSTDPN